MELKALLSAMPKPARIAFAERCGTTLGHLQNIMYGIKPCATDIAVAIERESKSAVQRWDLRRDWRNHWPELIGAEGAPACAEDEAKAGG